MSAHSAQILPMRTAGTQNFIERTYREGSQFQWVRETVVNAQEANATHIEFGIEWQAVENLGVYRRMISDNGCGMTSEQLVEFFNTFGGGGKPIGGAHENFGVGSKTSLLPWNTYGMVVISWVNGDASMIWVTLDKDSGEYGLKLERCLAESGDTTLECVYDPYDDPEHGCDWAAVKPDWIQDHGTVIVLLGDNANSDTVEGDPSRNEADIKGISSFLNRRMWTLRDGVELFVDELRSNDRAFWPPNQEIAHGIPEKSGRDRRTNTRRIEGARFYIKYPVEKFSAHGKLGAHGTVPLRDGTFVDWFLWDGERPKIQSYAAISGYIAAMYNDELYDITAHHSTYRSFGVSEGAVRSRLWLVIRPPVDPDGKRGVYPKTDRNSLLIKGGPTAGGPLPINDWAAEFADKMPDELVQAIKATRVGTADTITDEEWREKLAERFGSRWRITRIVSRRTGTIGIDETDGQPVRKSKPKTPRELMPSPDGPPSVDSDDSPTARQRPLRFGKPGDSGFGGEASTGGGIPKYRPVRQGDGVGDGMMAAWQPNDKECPEGVVLLNIDHPVLRSIVKHWQAQYADLHAETIEKDVIRIYGQVAVSKVAHSEHLKAFLPSAVVDKELRSEASLTMSLLGLMAEDQLIATTVGGKYSKKRYAVTDKRSHRPTAPR